MELDVTENRILPGSEITELSLCTTMHLRPTVFRRVGNKNRQRSGGLRQSRGEAVAGMRLASTKLVMTTTCSNCGNFDAHEKIRSIGGTWHRCARCNHAWRGLGHVLAAMLRRPQLDPFAQAEVVNRDCQPLPEQARAARPEPATSMAPGSSGVVRRTAAPTARRLSSSDARLSDQGLSVDEHWLAVVEARFDGSRELTVDASVASDMPARDPDPRVEPERQPARALKADAHRVARPQVSMDPTGDHWLAGVEVAYEQGYVSEETPSATGCPTLDESSSVTVCRSDPEDVPAPLDTRVEMDDWFDDMEEVIPLQRPDADVRCRVERRENDTEARRPSICHPDAPGVAALQDNRPAPAVPVAVLVSQLGEMDADLVRVRDIFARSDAVFSRIVSRWHPGAVPVGPAAGGR